MLTDLTCLFVYDFHEVKLQFDVKVAKQVNGHSTCESDLVIFDDRVCETASENNVLSYELSRRFNINDK